ncbi:MAG: PAS domain-containing protein, partial [Pseudomonadota bacterium]
MLQTILLIQHESTSAGIVREALLDSRDTRFHVECAGTCAEGLARLTRTIDGSHPAIDAVLTNLSLPDSQGTTTFDRLYQATPQIPILVICACTEEQVAKVAVQRGAQDYLFEERLDRYLLPKTVRSMIQRAVIADSLFVEKERAQVTLNSIGDAVLSTDDSGKVTYLNAVAELLTGWQCRDALGQPLENVFHIIDATTRETIEHPMTMAMRENRTVSLTPNSVLIRRDGAESAIEDSAAPIHDRRG